MKICFLSKDIYNCASFNLFPDKPLGYKICIYIANLRSSISSISSLRHWISLRDCGKMLGGDCRNRLYQTLYNLLWMLEEIAVIKAWRILMQWCDTLTTSFYSAYLLNTWYLIPIVVHDNA